MLKALKYMTNMKRLPILVILVLAGMVLAFQSLGKSANPPSKYDKILRNVGQMLTEAHYSPKDINDEFSKKIFTKFMNDLDPDKNIFLQADYDALKKYETKIDDEIKGDAPVEFFLSSGEIFNKRIEDASKIYNAILDQPFSYTIDENINLNDDKIKISSNQTEFFPPVDKRYFDEQMSGSFFGIGAQLTYDDGNIKIASLVAGTPAWKSGEIQVGD